MPFIHDDLELALRRAGESGRPLVIDLWAPWCHTCLSMQHTVFTDPALVAMGPRFVWLALDTDRPENAGAIERFRPEVWPTFYVVSWDGVDGLIQASQAGSTTVAGFRQFLLRGEQGALESASLTARDPLWHLRLGDREVAARHQAQAERAYREALRLAPPEWPRAPEVLVRLARTLYRQERYRACAELALSELPRAVSARDASGSDFAVYANLCADKFGAKPLAARVREALVAPEASLAWLARLPDAPLSADDRSDALATLREVYDALGRPADARAAAAAQVEVLDAAVAAARGPMAQMTYAWPRSEVYVYLGRGQDVLPWLQQLTAALPEQYDPPHRAAWVLHRLGRDAEALPLAERAWSLAYGPRRERIAALRDEVARALAAPPAAAPR
ncbi:MAG: thioredoxin family protein [Deltaproteobacteria bacterium]|nr:thioredoxin family protein [Deltaproteobacteria bacterium]